jgi:hypothetical protein
MKYFSQRDFFWIFPLSFALGAALSFLQPGNRLIGWLGFSFLFLLSFLLLTFFTRWASGGSTAFNPTNTGFALLPRSTLGLRSAKALIWMVALAFALRLVGGVATYLALPVDGFDDEDDKAGYIYTDAHRRDAQAWELASSDQPIITAFTDKFTYDQYGGLLAFSALIYRYFSPDVHRPLMMALVSALVAALGLPILWKAVNKLWDERIALASCWIFALFPESILLGGSAMREPYLMTFCALTLWGFGIWQESRDHSAWIWGGLGLAGMLLVNPVVAVGSLVLFIGWAYFTSERSRISWWAIVITVLVFLVSLFILSSALNRQGHLDGGTPVGIIGSFLREAIKWDVYQLERGSGWVQKLFDEMPEWLRLPFVMVYGLFQPVLPAAFIEPTTLTWRIIGILRAVGWWALLPVLVFSLLAAAGAKSTKEKRSEFTLSEVEGSDAKRKLWMWITFFVWTWILLSSLRGGGDQWDNPRYRTILFMWEAILAGYALIWWREMKSPWLLRVVAMEVLFLSFFSQWYANRYYHFGPQLEFGQMVTFILGSWVLVIFGGWVWDRRMAKIA